MEATGRSGGAVTTAAKRESMLERAGAASGLLFALTVAAAAMLGDPWDPATNPNPTQSADALAAALAANSEEARLGSYLMLLGTFFLVWFVAYLRDRLRGGGTPEWIASTAFGGGLLIAAVLLVGASGTLAASEPTGFGADTQVAKMFFMWGWNYMMLLAPPAAAVVLASALASAAIPRLLRWASVATTLVLLTFSLMTMPGVGGILFMLWAAIASVTFLVAGDGTAANREPVSARGATVGP